MDKNRTMTYMALLLSLGMTAGAVLSVGDAQARNTADTKPYYTVLQAQSGRIRSDFLVSEGKQTVLLGSLDSGETVSASFTLEARDPVQTQMVWYATDGAPAQVQVDFRMEAGTGSYTDNRYLDMSAGSKAVVTLMITADESIPKDKTMHVEVYCGSLDAVFQVDLMADPPVVEEPGKTIVPTELEETIAPTEPVETIDPAEQVEPTEETALNESEEQVGIISELATIELKTLSEFELTELLPVKAALSGQADRLRIGLEAEPLPAMTRYTADGGQNWYVLYEEGYIELEGVPNGEEPAQWHLLVDFTRTELSPDESVRLEAEAWMLEEPTGVCYADLIPREAPERSKAVRILRRPDPEEQYRIAVMIGEETEPTVPPETEQDVPEVPQETEPTNAGVPAETTAPTETTAPAEPTVPTEPAIPSEPEDTVDPEAEWAEGAYLKVLLPVGWAESAEVRYRAEFLETSAGESVGYTEVPWDAQGLNAMLLPETGELIVYTGVHAPPAGTYRLTLECMFEGICFHRSEMTFFINYSTRSDLQNEEVPDNE